MPLVIIVLHEKYKFEIIPDSDHDTVRSEFQKIGCFKIVSQNGVDKHLLRDSYFGETTDRSAIEAAFDATKKKLNRRAAMQVSMGETYAYDLEPVSAPYTTLASLIGTVPAIPVAPGAFLGNVLGNVHKAPTPTSSTDTSPWASILGYV